MCEMTGEYQKVDGINEMIDVFESEGMSRMNENWTPEKDCGKPAWNGCDWANSLMSSINGMVLVMKWVILLLLNLGMQRYWTSVLNWMY